MARLIDADELLKIYEGRDNFLGAVLMDTSTIDIIPVIRCKDCKYWNRNNYRCANVPCVVYKLEDDYCSGAERREE